LQAAYYHIADLGDHALVDVVRKATR
jgi:hypothetical protein